LGGSIIELENFFILDGKSLILSILRIWRMGRERKGEEGKQLKYDADFVYSY